MTVAANEAVIHTLTSTGAASYTAVPIRIISASSIRVFNNGVELASANFSVTAIDNVNYTFTLNLSPVIPAGNTILVIQDFPVEREADMSPGQQLPSASYNASLDNITIMVKDQAKIQNLTNMRYDIGKADEVTEQMTAIPIPTGDDYSLIWNSATGFAWGPNHPGGQTVGEFKSELAGIGGAELVGYNTGSGSSDLQTQVSANVTAIANNLSNITANTANITANSANITANTANITANAANIATNTTNIASLKASATSPTANGAYQINFWQTDVTAGGTDNVQDGLRRALEGRSVYANIHTITGTGGHSRTFTTPGVEPGYIAQAQSLDQSFYYATSATALTGAVKVWFNEDMDAQTGDQLTILVFRPT